MDANLKSMNYKAIGFFLQLASIIIHIPLAVNIAGKWNYRKVKIIEEKWFRNVYP